MAVLTEVSDEQAGALCRLYGLGELDALTGIPQGIENTNYKLMAGGKRYILTLFEGRTDLSELPYFLTLMNEVAEAGLPAPRPLEQAEGGMLTEVAGKPAAILSFLRGKDIPAPTPEDAHGAGAFLARLHQVTANTSLHRPNSMGVASWQVMAKRLSGRLDHFAGGLEAEVSDVLSELTVSKPSGLPRGAIHADYFPDNLLWSDGAISGVIDFYFACTDDLAYDLAVAMNAYTPEDRPDEGQGDALLEGYETVRPLTKAEKAALPAFLTGSALRFFLSRATDLVFPPQGALYQGKDPLPWLELMRKRREKMGAAT
ncbi:homoserine kinase [Parvularcula maris]|uniref:Homoserine kinase n=1 Tax=Parvularcula maris TaxID=2965077 RepID=A0A9X2LD64_9PROT|nr:homoserine kinase [Parvularcula maris]MCQ8186382.1 homoserine kinase [Parvularcula maris]